MARGRSGRRKNDSLVGSLLRFPWYVSVGLGALVFVVTQWVLPGLDTNSKALPGVFMALRSVSWVFVGALMLIGLAAFVRERMARAPGGEPPVPPTGSGPADRSARSSRRPVPVSRSAGAARIADAPAGTPARPPEAAAPAAGTAPVAASDAAATRPAAWTIELIQALEWKRFEDVCQQFYEAKGIRSKTTPLGPDGGIDIHLFQDDTARPTSVVQCKARLSVGVKPVRELLGVMVSEKVEKAFFMTSGRFTEEAKAFARANRITLIDGDMFLMMVRRLPAAIQQSLLEFAVAGDYAIPTCPRCGAPMKHVAGRNGRPDFWGCSSYPRCRQTLGMRGAKA